MHEKLIDELFRLEQIRYVAIYQNLRLTSRQKDSIENESASESDKYEEILVNPTVLKILRQRGEIDCGGLNFVVIRYGNFYQLVREIPNGHISICIDEKADPIEIEHQIGELIKNSFS